MRYAKARACMEGRAYVIPDDVKKLASSVLAHRLVFSFGRSRQEEAVKLLEDILAAVPVPVEDFSRK